MSKTGHITERLSAYYDHELSPREQKQIAAHLDVCPACRAELEQLRALSRLLQESPMPAHITRPDQFVTQVKLRLPRRSSKTAWQRGIEAVWRLAPVGLIGSGAFIQAVAIVSGMLTLALRLGGEKSALLSVFPMVSSSTGPWLAEILNMSSASLGELWKITYRCFQYGGPLGWGVTLRFIATALISLLYLTWMAMWWACSRHYRDYVNTHQSEQ